jgi:5S rRNA maturation endonuclease (ribonuclease M5)
MNKQQTIDWLKKLHIKVPNLQPRSHWVVSECPLGPWRHAGGASGPDVFGVRLDVGDAFCNCFACSWHSKQSDLILEMRRLNKQAPANVYPFGELLQACEDAEQNAELAGLHSPDLEELLFAKREPPHEFPQWWIESFPSIFDIGWAMDYVKTGREGCDPVPDHILQLLAVRVDTEQKRVCFPVRDFHGTALGLHGRAVLPGVEPRYRMYTHAHKNNPLIWLGEHWVDLEQPIVVVEGPFDLASVMRVYRNVVTPLFANPNETKLLRMAGAADWITLLDRGTGGDFGRKKMEKVVKDSIVQHAFPPEGKKDPGAMNVDELCAILAKFVKIDPIIAC